MSIKVLVADDSITIQKVIGIIFGGDEYSLTVVDNGKSAVDKAREIIPDILLIDALMPGMTGYEVAEMVRATPSLAAKPILILTGSFEPFDEEKAKKCGADDFIAKPFESQQIIAKVKELLILGSSREQAVIVPPPEPVIEQVSDFSVPPPLRETPPPVEVLQTEASADIWGAFTPEEKPPVAAEAAPQTAPPTATAFEPDVFAIVTEENEADLVQSTTPAYTSPSHTGTQWVPVEENTFEFEEEPIAEPPHAVFADQRAPVQEASFGDIAFEDDVVTPSVQTFTAAPEPEVAVPVPDFADFAPVSTEPGVIATPFAPLADPTPQFVAPVEPVAAEPIAVEQVAPATVKAAPSALVLPAALTEEQLKVALSAVSKEIIERIVWEVVPDLAEALIREAIRRIKEGV